MMAISSPQYVWTLFVKPFQTATGGTLPAIQVTFSLLIVLQTWLSPFQGWLIERFGARFLITLGCLLSGLGWIASAGIGSVSGLYLTYGLFCGVGTGIVYIGIVGLMLKWFPDRRGFATGVVAAGYGFGAILTTFPIDTMIEGLGLSGDAGDVRRRVGRRRGARGSVHAAAAGDRDRQASGAAPRGSRG